MMKTWRIASDRPSAARRHKEAGTSFQDGYASTVDGRPFIGVLYQNHPKNSIFRLHVRLLRPKGREHQRPRFIIMFFFRCFVR